MYFSIKEISGLQINEYLVNTSTESARTVKKVCTTMKERVQKLYSYYTSPWLFIHLIFNKELKQNFKHDKWSHYI